VVAEDVERGVKRFLKRPHRTNVELLVVERQLFESDVETSTLLEVVASRLLLPYKILAGADYLSDWDNLYKRRKLEESLIALVFEHPELSSELFIDPRYFIHDIVTRQSHLFPHAEKFLEDIDKEERSIEAYKGALKVLARSEIIRTDDGMVAVNRSFVDATLKQGIQVSNQLNRVHTQLQGLLKVGFRGAIDLLRPLLSFSLLNDALPTALGVSDLPSPKRFLHFPTAAGLSHLSESTSIEELIARTDPQDIGRTLKLQRYGGVLNEVFLLTYAAGDTTRRIILKRYPNWVSLKWAPLALWTVGTKNFAVLGRSRMERECAATNFLSRVGIPVPKILSTSFGDRLLLKEFVEGRNLVGVIKAVIKKGGTLDGERALLSEVGATVATVHKGGATLGDCKPENFIAKPEGYVVVVDLEQSSRGGNETWDLAEFLYFSGHYVGPLDPTKGVSEVARCFIEGYLNGGGNIRRITEAARFKYAKIFAPITLPQAIRAIARTCRKKAEEC
jgi:tRNA A-37 threonylcarbamoyl transferase component Bud32